MKKICISVGVLLSLLRAGYGQSVAQPAYETRKLKIEEVNLVSSYYHQDGNNSAVTGGIGTEKLTDFAEAIDLVLTATDRKNRQHTLAFDVNIDHYTSASSDNIDPLTVSSASRSDTHIYPSIAWSVHNNATRTTRGIALSYSTEYDYKSYGINLNFAKASADNNREISLKRVPSSTPGKSFYLPNSGQKAMDQALMAIETQLIINRVIRTTLVSRYRR